MDGEAVNCSSNTPDAVRERTDELGGCSDIPRENSSHTLCACMCVCLYVWEHVQTWKKDISDQFTEEVYCFDGSDLIAAFIFNRSSTSISWLRWHFANADVGRIILRNVKADPFCLTPWSTESSALLRETVCVWGEVPFLHLKIFINTAVFSIVKNSIL